MPQLESIAGNLNTFNQSELDRMYNLALPGYDKIRDRVAGNISDWTQGKIPQDVSDAVQRNSAVRSLYGGFGSSGMSRNLTARDLGLTSLDLMGKGMDAAQRWLQTVSAPRFDVSSMFIRPEFQAQFAASERDAKFQRDYVANQWDWYGSFGQQLVRFEDTAVQLASSIAGAAV